MQIVSLVKSTFRLFFFVALSLLLGSANAFAQVTGVVKITPQTRNESASKTALLLAEKGTAALPIVISAQASKPTIAVAEELAAILEEISGAKFAVQTGDGKSGIVLGTSAEFPTLALNEALKIYNGFDGKEAFAIRTEPGRLLLIGATDKGASHAASRFLEEIGYRHFFPHKAWVVVPKIAKLSFNRDITDRPQILVRNIWFQAGSGGSQPHKDYQSWKRHNLAAASFDVNISGGGMSKPFTAEIRAAHPEYQPLLKQKDGTLARGWKGSWQPELGNPGARKVIIDYAVNYFKKNPNADMVNLDPADTTRHSQSPESLALGSVSESVFAMANEAARAVEKEFPGQHKMVGILSYNKYYDPPRFKMEPNVHVQLASASVNPEYSPEERAKLWQQRSSNLGVYDYYSVWAWSHDSLLNGSVNGVYSFQKRIRDKLVARNIISVSAESTSSWGSLGRGYYVANKMMWNPNQDLDALLDDFYSKAFGPAAPMMKKYYEAYDRDNGPLMSANLLGHLFRNLNQASIAAKDRPDVMARLDQLKLYMRFVDLTWRRGSEGEKVNNNLIMSNLFRTREYALTSWEMIRQGWGKGKRPGKPDSPVWMVDKPYTHEEIEADFQEGLARYEPKIRDVGPRLEYSADLVPVTFPGTKAEQNIPSHQAYQGSTNYALYSLKGEPLEFTTKAMGAWGYLTSYSVTDADGKVVSSGEKLATKVALAHKIAVPKAGLYFLNFKDPGAYWIFDSAAGLASTIIMTPESPLGKSSEFQDMYIYVPKGTKSLTYFNAGRSHTLLGPDNSEQAKVAKNDYAVVPVPAGMDGKLWKLSGVKLGRIIFYNVPPYIAPSPNALLVPREVAEKDGLKIRK